MSNPAVITLADVKTEIGNFRVEDNIGEAIHLHLGEFRYDLTIEQFHLLSAQVTTAIDDYMQDVPGFDISSISKEFFLQKADCWPDLLSVEIEKIKLNDLIVDTYDSRGRGAFLPLENSRIVKALRGDNSENEKRKERNYYGQSNQERLDSMLESIKTNGYPYLGQYIVVFNDTNVIVDGQHRAGCLYHLYGNVEVEIMRMHFKDKKHSPIVKRTLFSKLFIWDLKKIKKHLRNAYHFTKEIEYKFKRKRIAVLVANDRIRYRRRSK